MAKTKTVTAFIVKMTSRVLRIVHTERMLRRFYTARMPLYQRLLELPVMQRLFGVVAKLPSNMGTGRNFSRAGVQT